MVTVTVSKLSNNKKSYKMSHVENNYQNSIPPAGNNLAFDSMKSPRFSDVRDLINHI
jgi:hypothetical protein